MVCAGLEHAFGHPVDTHRHTFTCLHQSSNAETASRPCPMTEIPQRPPPGAKAQSPNKHRQEAAQRAKPTLTPPEV
jgi:hypothetical protein